MTNDKEQQSDDKKRPKERKQRKRRKRAHGTGSIFRRPERKGKQWVVQMLLEHGKTRQRYFNTRKKRLTRSMRCFMSCGMEYSLPRKTGR